MSVGGLHRLQEEAHAHGLMVMGGFHPEAGDQVPDGAGTLVMLGPEPTEFWPLFTRSPEFNDGDPAPMDRWSDRVITALAAQMGGQALFPFGGPPYHPFLAWAKRTGRAWSSPVGLLVHDAAGLFVSYRGAIAVPERLTLPTLPLASPCKSCTEQPCRTACPAGALTPDGYDVPACKSYIASDSGTACMTRGCAVRRACPVSQAHGRIEEQSAFHMAAFL
ncbi:MAG: ferredoxin [Sediminimonas sp.]|uniref:ferredoxin n=1 Tax=Sediminimonas sp. TaxID=2823379 RepID=UPI00286FEAD6|nr:ferredoxin [Sediminimonas sp.]MDR9484831.1 ferredoxin [Sediminimonas sp.]